jgi:sulfur-oxidizing protein SoxY
MTSFVSDLRRRDLLAGGAALAGLAAAGLGPTSAQAQSTTAMPQLDSAEADRLAAEFAGEAEPLAEGLALDLPALGDNPAAVPIRVHVTEPITEASWCEEIIILADLNPKPFACRFRFTAATGSAEVAVRLRLIQTMPIRAYARMNDGRVLMARQDITVAAGGCGL